MSPTLSFPVTQRRPPVLSDMKGGRRVKWGERGDSVGGVSLRHCAPTLSLRQYTEKGKWGKYVQDWVKKTEDGGDKGGMEKCLRSNFWSCLFCTCHLGCHLRRNSGKIKVRQGKQCKGTRHKAKCKHKLAPANFIVICLLGNQLANRASYMVRNIAKYLFICRNNNTFINFLIHRPLSRNQDPVIQDIPQTFLWAV